MIGILGGTFDPIHNGHLHTARDLRDRLQLEEVRFIPCGIPPHRDPPLADKAQRLAMVETAIQGESGFVLDDREIRRDGLSYMVETLESLREELGPDRSIGLILGLDAFAGLEDWYQWQRLIELGHLLVMTRPGYSAQDIQSSGLQALLKAHQTSDREACSKQPAGGVLFCQVPELDISSTVIREKLRAGKDVSELLPAAVLELIRQQHIYG